MINPSPLFVQGIIQDIQANDYGIFYFRKDADRYNAYQKYKRCIAMAKWLECEANFADMLESHWYHTRAEWFKKWMHKWQQIAEKLRHNDSTTMPKAPEYGERNCKNCLQCYELEDKDTFYKVFCKQAGHWMDWYKEYNCTQFIQKEAK